MTTYFDSSYIGIFVHIHRICYISQFSEIEDLNTFICNIDLRSTQAIEHINFINRYDLQLQCMEIINDQYQ